GVPNTMNAHPHMTAEVCVVHNGIIENFLELRETLRKKGYPFASDTDTEVIPVLITDYIKQGLTPKQASAESRNMLYGAFALGAPFEDDPGATYMARRGSPQAIGHGDDAMYMASDAIALAPLTNRITYLQEGDWAILRADGAEIFDENDHPVNRLMVLSQTSGAAIGKG